MNARKAKEIRKEIFGDRSIRGTKYQVLTNGMIIADDLRRAYGYAKRGLDLRKDGGRIR